MADNELIEVLIDRVDEIVCNHCRTALNVSECPPFSHVTCSNCGTKLPVPAKLANFVLVEPMGQGGMGAVFRGFDSSLKRHVAIKVMKKEFSENPQFVEQFLREARALAALNHPNVVQIYNYGDEKGQHYIVMELVDGGRLDLIIKSGKLPNEAAMILIAMDVVQGLHAAANAGLTHGDVKPANILFSREGAAKVVDFGLARFQGEKPKPGVIWGTPFYVAPEVVRGKQPDQKADIYSLGGTLFHALSGHPPFNESTVPETIVARFKKPAPDIRTLRPEIHSETAAMIARMLEVDSFMRYPNYDSLMADLKNVQKALTTPPAKKPRKSPVPLILTLLGLSALVAAGLYGRHVHKKQTALVTPPPPSKGVVMKMVNGKLVPVAVEEKIAPSPSSPVSPKAPSAKKSVEVKVTTATGQGADSYIAGSPPEMVQGQSDILWAKAGMGNRLEVARKVYLRFDLSGIDRTKLTNVVLTLSAASTSKNKADGRYSLLLWGLHENALGANWVESSVTPNRGDAPPMNWKNAPGNELQDVSRMTADAELLAVIQPPANPTPGESIVFSNATSKQPNGMLDFIQNGKSNVRTFVITAGTDAEQKAGWKFASKENGRLPSPTLTLQGTP
jgi:serine/threonine protein kinase